MPVYCPDRGVAEHNHGSTLPGAAVAVAATFRRRSMPSIFAYIKALSSASIEGLHRVHAGVVDRTSAADAAILRLRRRGLRQDLRGADPIRRHPRDPVDLFREAVEDLASDFSPTRRRGVSSSASCWPSCRRRWSAPSAHGFIKSVLFNPMADLLHADRRRRHALWIDSSISSRAITTPDVHAADVFHDRRRAMLSR